MSNPEDNEIKQKKVFLSSIDCFLYLFLFLFSRKQMDLYEGNFPFYSSILAIDTKDAITNILTWYAFFFVVVVVVLSIFYHSSSVSIEKGSLPAVQRQFALGLGEKGLKKKKKTKQGCESI